jgi:putative spermidine/putrescine transport system permease protein
MATPYVIGPIVAVLQRFNMRLEEAALIHGASRWSTLRRITLPVIMPGIYVGALYAFMISFADLPVSMMLAGTGYRPFPVELFQAMDYDFNPALLAVSTIIIAFSIVAMLAVQRLVGLQALLRAGGGG